MNKQHTDRYPLILKCIQAINYIAVLVSLVAAVVYLFGSDESITQFNGGVEPLNRYGVGVTYLFLVALVGIVINKFRKRDMYAPEIYVLANIFGFALVEIIDYFNDYLSPIGINVAAYTLEAATMAYLLFSKDVKTYFGKK